MRISDWSSDVCSSDLANSIWALAHKYTGRPCLTAPTMPLPIACPHCPMASHGQLARARRLKQEQDCDSFSRTCRTETARCRSEEHTSELQSLMRISYAVFCLKKKKCNTIYTTN